jgi:hypothetical protein
VNTLICRFLSPEQTKELSPDLPVWFEPFWMNPIASLFKITPKVLVCFKNDNPIAFLPFYEKSLLTVKKAYNPVLVYYCPLVFNIPPKKDANRELLLEYDITVLMGETLKRNYNRILLNLSPNVFDMRGFKDSGLTASPHYTFYINPEHSNNIFPDERTKLRKSLKEDYRFSKYFSPEKHLDLLYKMYSRKNHLFQVNKRDLVSLLIELNNSGLIEQFVIKKKDKIVSSLINIIDRENMAYGWQVASEPEDMQNGVSILMFWSIFKELSGRNMIFD